MQRARRYTRPPSDFTDVEALVRPLQQKRENLPAIGAKPDFHELGRFRGAGSSHIENVVANMRTVKQATILQERWAEEGQQVNPSSTHKLREGVGKAWTAPKARDQRS